MGWGEWWLNPCFFVVLGSWFDFVYSKNCLTPNIVGDDDPLRSRNLWVFQPPSTDPALKFTSKIQRRWSIRFNFEGSLYSPIDILQSYLVGIRRCLGGPLKAFRASGDTWGVQTPILNRYFGCLGSWWYLSSVVFVCAAPPWSPASDYKISNLDLPPNNPVAPVVNTGLFQDSRVDPTFHVLSMASMMIVSPMSTIGFPGEGGIAVEQRDPRNGPVVEPEDQVQHGVLESEMWRDLVILEARCFWFNLYGGKWYVRFLYFF